MVQTCSVVNTQICVNKPIFRNQNFSILQQFQKRKFLYLQIDFFKQISKKN